MLLWLGRGVDLLNFGWTLGIHHNHLWDGGHLELRVRIFFYYPYVPLPCVVAWSLFYTLLFFIFIDS